MEEISWRMQRIWSKAIEKYCLPEPGILGGGGGAGDACLSCTSEGDKLSLRERCGGQLLESDGAMR